MFKTFEYLGRTLFENTLREHSSRTLNTLRIPQHLLSDENETNEGIDMIYTTRMLSNGLKGNQIVLISDKVRGSLHEFGNSIKFKDRIFAVIVFGPKETSD